MFIASTVAYTNQYRLILMSKRNFHTLLSCSTSLNCSITFFAIMQFQLIACISFGIFVIGLLARGYGTAVCNVGDLSGRPVVLFDQKACDIYYALKGNVTAYYVSLNKKHNILYYILYIKRRPLRHFGMS